MRRTHYICTHHISALIAALALSGCQPHTNQADPAEDRAITQTTDTLSEQYQQLAEAYFQQRLALEPILASQLGERRYQDQWGDPLSERYLKARHDLNLGYLAKLAALDWQQLPEEMLLSAKLLRYELEFALKDETFPSRFLPLDPLDNPVLTLAQLTTDPSIQPLNNQQDHQDLIARISQFSTWVDSAIMRMQQGTEQQIVLPRVLVRQVIAQLQSLLDQPIEQSPFYQPMTQLPVGLSLSEQQALSEGYQQVLSQSLFPAINTLIEYLQQDYLPHARGSVGWQYLPNGKAWYQHLIKQHTTLTLSADELHRQGLTAIAQQQDRIIELQTELGFNGNLKSFFQQLRTVLPLADKFSFTQWPSAPALTINSSLPSFHHASHYSAFEFGRILYFSHQQQIHSTELWQQLNWALNQHLQALRLVVDTGLHAKGWSQAQSIQYLLDHSPLSQAEAEAEVARYIARPAQALAYQIGLQQFLILQQQAKQALAEHFTLEEFHQLLNAEALPLSLLEQKVANWIELKNSESSKLKL